MRSIKQVSQGVLGDRKIDVLLKDAVTPDAPVLRVALETGIAL